RKPTGHGGWRPGAGRPRGRTKVAHDEKPEIPARYPVLVTWRIVEGVRSLRSEYLVAIIRKAISDSQKSTFAIAEFSVQSNHLHLICETAGKRGLASGLKGLAKRMTARLNAKLRRSGRLIDSRGHTRAMKTPREVKSG